jgi:hypothetical protein
MIERVRIIADFAGSASRIDLFPGASSARMLTANLTATALNTGGQRR